MSERATSLLACTGLEAGYGSRQVLFGVDLTVEAGEIVAVLGTNGAGKSTLLRTISQLVAPTAGSVVVDGADITGLGPRAAIRRGIVHVPGGRGVFPTLTVAEHFRTASFLCPDRRTAERRVSGAADVFPILRERWTQRAGDLSGGEQQQLALATAMLSEPKLLLVDELSLGLAPAAVDALIEVVRVINSSGCTIVVVEQSVDVAGRLAERAYFMEKGRVRFSGPISELADRTDLVRPVFLDGRAQPSARRVAAPVPERGPRLSLRAVRKRFGGIVAVDGVSLDVPAGAIVGLVGPNGAGKTTLLDLVSGFLRPDEGSIALDAGDITTLAPHRRARLGLGRSFQDAPLFPALTVAEASAVAFESHLDVRDHLASILALPEAQAMEDDLLSRVDELLGVHGLRDHAEARVAELSTGTRRVLELAMAVAHRPRVLLLDEPSAGLAQAEVDALGPLLLRLRDEIGCSMLVIEHDLAFISAISDDLVALVRGRVLARGRPDAVLGDPAVVAAYLGTASVGQEH